MQSITYSELFSIARESDQSLKNYMGLLRNIISKTNFNFKTNAEEVMREPTRLFSLKLYQRWCKSARNYKNFMKTNATMLKNRFLIPQEALEITHINCDKPSTSTAKKLKPFSQIGYRQKKRRIKILRVNNTSEELAFATKLSLQAAGNEDIAAALSHLINNPEDASRIRAFCEGKTNENADAVYKRKSSGNNDKSAIVEIKIY